MWVMFEGGFVSAVQDRDDHGILRVRARDQRSLTTMLDIIKLSGHDTGDLKPVTSAGTDYRWRVLLPRELFGVFLAQVSDDISYGNFKDQATKTRGKKWHDAFMDVWVAMLAVDDGPKFKRGWDLAGRKVKA